MWEKLPHCLSADVTPRTRESGLWMPVATFRIKFLETGYLLSDLTIRLDRRGQDGMATFITGFYSFLEKFTDSAGLGEIMNFLMSLVANHSLKYYQTESPFHIYMYFSKKYFSIQVVHNFLSFGWGVVKARTMVWLLFTCSWWPWTIRSFSYAVSTKCSLSLHSAPTNTAVETLPLVLFREVNPPNSKKEITYLKKADIFSNREDGSVETEFEGWGAWFFNWSTQQ